jgi:hypothetical protein
MPITSFGTIAKLPPLPPKLIRDKIQPENDRSSQPV